MTATESRESEEFVREVRGKTRRLSIARKHSGGFWRHLAHVGSLGFVFVLPLIAGAALGRFLSMRTELPGIALAFILLGLVVGAYGAWRLICQSLGGADE